MSAALFDIEDALTNGQWVRRGLIWAWVENPHKLGDRPSWNPHDLIACPTCHARMDERCKTRLGKSAQSHDSRLVARVCGCGGPIRAREPMCGFCRADMVAAA
jgi:hypothetical protein